jgi:hypothetical protein
MIPVDSRPNFGGVWEINFEKSKMVGPAPKRILMKIDHREPMLIQQILFTSEAGTRQLAFTYITGTETENLIGNARARTRAEWDETELVIESRMNTPDHQVFFKDHWSLSDAGTTLTMTHRDDALAGQISVLEKAPQEYETRFDDSK